MIQSDFKSMIFLKNKKRLHKGFTLIESILYVAIFSFFASVSIGFFWQMRQVDIRDGIFREVKENATQSIEVIKYFARNAEGLNLASSQLSIHPGSMDLIYASGNRLIDTYVKSITVGGQSIDIRKLRLNQNGNAVDLTSDLVSVKLFRVNRLTQGTESESIEAELVIEKVNPGYDINYGHEFALQTTINLRKEL